MARLLPAFAGADERDHDGATIGSRRDLPRERSPCVQDSVIWMTLDEDGRIEHRDKERL